MCFNRVSPPRSEARASGNRRKKGSIATRGISFKRQAMTGKTDSKKKHWGGGDNIKKVTVMLNHIAKGKKTGGEREVQIKGGRRG